MAKTYQQCEFSSEDYKVVAWIESRYAKEGLKLKFKNDGRWWTVDKVHDIKLTEEYLKKYETIYKVHRSATDI